MLWDALIQAQRQTLHLCISFGVFTLSLVSLSGLLVYQRSGWGADNYDYVCHALCYCSIVQDETTEQWRT